jgi:hypothetical protein
VDYNTLQYSERSIMAERPTETPGTDTYTARLHLIERDTTHRHSGYRALLVPGLVEPHFEVLASMPIVDEESKKEYNSFYEVPGLLAVDFPVLANPRQQDNPDWLSRDKRSLYDDALKRGEAGAAAALLGTPLDAQLHTTHFFTGEYDTNGLPIFVNANRLMPIKRTVPYIPTAYMGERLIAFTIGTGQKNKTDAIKAAIAAAAAHDVLPPAPTPTISPVDLRKIALLALLASKKEEPVHPNYLLSSYTPVKGLPKKPKTQKRYKPSKDELAFLDKHKIKHPEGELLPAQAYNALVWREVDKRFPDKSVFVTSAICADVRTPRQIKAAQKKREKMLRNTQQPAPKAKPLEPDEIARINEAMKHREIERQRTLR